MVSMRSITSLVNLATTSSVCMFSTTCCAFDAPVMTVLTFGFFKHHAIANCAIEQPRSCATSANCLTFSMLRLASSFSNRSRSHSYPSNVARVPVGMPVLYLPVSKPLANGLQIVVPNPISE